MSPLLEQAIAGFIGALTVALLAYIQHKQSQWAKENAGESGKHKKQPKTTTDDNESDGD